MDGISEILATYNCVSLDEKIQFELDGVVEKEIKQAYCIENLEFCVSCMDYTTLKVSDTEESVKNFTADLLKKLKKFNLRDVAAVCVFSNYAGIVREGLKGTEIQTAVVAGEFFWFCIAVFSSKSSTATEEILHFVSSLVEIPRKISQSMPLYENAAKFFNANIIKR